MDFQKPIAKLSYRELQERCRKNNLSASGNASTLRKRLQSKATATNIAQQQQQANKRSKKCPSDDLICPITRELPWEPVTAEDGRVYERSAIEKHIRTAKRGELKSPVTNTAMGKRLLPAPQHRSLTETLIESKSISGELADAWQEKVEQMQEMEDLLKQAKQGDSEAMYEVAENYMYGANGFKQSMKSAYSYYKKAHQAGNVKATGGLGEALCEGWGTETNCTDGVMYITMAAAAGSDYAAQRLGSILALGQFGATKNKDEATRWLLKALNDDMPHKELSDSLREEVQGTLDNLLEGNGQPNGA